MTTASDERFWSHIREEHRQRYPDVVGDWNEPSVYVFSVPPYVKVGWSSCVYVREEQLAKGHGKPYKMPPGVPKATGGRLIAAWPASRKEERIHHRELAEHHVNGEWFHHNTAVAEWIRRKVAGAREARATA